MYQKCECQICKRKRKCYVAKHHQCNKCNINTQCSLYNPACGCILFDEKKKPNDFKYLRAIAITCVVVFLVLLVGFAVNCNNATPNFGIPMEEIQTV